MLRDQRDLARGMDPDDQPPAHAAIFKPQSLCVDMPSLLLNLFGGDTLLFLHVAVSRIGCLVSKCLLCHNVGRYAQGLRQL